ncbi:hypothetical protein [Streptomyces sp. NPDC005525]|uniref:hypothetical protein n=1 Tax=Streptomyces sp. NPDC005525 TaxID=3364720 RepID=UPI00367EBBA6
MAPLSLNPALDEEALRRTAQQFAHGDRTGDGFPDSKRLLFTFAAVGMLAGGHPDRSASCPGHWPNRFGAPPLMLSLAAPYLIFVLHPALPVALAAVVLASIGFSANLLLQERLMSLAPSDSSEAHPLHLLKGRTRPSRATNPLIELSVTELRRLLHGAEHDLTNFLALAAEWAAQHLPDHSAPVTAALARALALPAPTAPSKP